MASVNFAGRPALLASILGFFGGCGDPLIDIHVRGAPVYSEYRNPMWVEPGEPDLADLRVAFFYNPGNPETIQTETWLEHTASTTRIFELPSRVALNVFELPGDELLAHDASGVSLGYGVARLLAYRDTNQDGARSLDEPFIGGTFAWNLLYLPAPLPKEKLPTYRAMDAGFRWVYLTQPCGQAPPGPLTDGDCGVPLGQRCVADNDCHGGSCLTQTKTPWRGGYCVVTEPSPTGCRPAASVYLARTMRGAIPPAVQGFYLKPCQTDDECLRPNESSKDLYSCDPGLGACVPRDQHTMNIGVRADIESFCANATFIPKS